MYLEIIIFNGTISLPFGGLPLFKHSGRKSRDTLISVSVHNSFCSSSLWDYKDCKWKVGDSMYGWCLWAKL